jgi:hypothetical protein
MYKVELNPGYIKIASEIFKGCANDRYIVLGSAATLSFTAKIGYSRKINDLDIISDSSLVDAMKQKLIKKGFLQSTFINKRMPFFQKLIKHGESTYLRFSKDDINVEILSTKFIKKDFNLIFDLYPQFWVKIPVNSLIQTKFGNAKFTTLDIDLLWAIKQLLNNTLGKVMSYKRKQRVEDLSNLKKLVTMEKAKELLSQSRFGYKSLSFKVPTFLLTGFYF